MDNPAFYGLEINFARISGCDFQCKSHMILNFPLNYGKKNAQGLLAVERKQHQANYK